MAARSCRFVLGSLADLKNSDQQNDVVIVGGGAAGLTLAHALGATGRSVLLFEAGGDKRTKASQEFYRGELVDKVVHPSTDNYRVRAIGGTSTIWGGRAIPFDPIDFEKRDWVPASGWPFGREALAGYYGRAMDAAEAGRPEFFPEGALPGAQKELAPGLDGDLVQTTVERFSKPTNFWRRYGEELTRSDRVRIVKDAPVVHIQLAADGNSVDWIEVASPDGSRTKVRGRSYVLALGGLETTRLLLASNDVRQAGIGNDSDHLGRNYMSHLCATSGTISFAGPPDGVAYDYARDAEGIYVRRRLWLTERAQRDFSLLNTTFRTHLPEPADPSHGDAILSAMFLVKDMVLYEYSRKFVENPVSWGGRLRHVKNIATQPFRLASFGTNWLQKRTFAERKLPSVVLGLRFLPNATPSACRASRSTGGSPNSTCSASRKATTCSPASSRYAVRENSISIARSWHTKRSGTVSSAGITSARRACPSIRETASSIPIAWSTASAISTSPAPRSSRPPDRPIRRLRCWRSHSGWRNSLAGTVRLDPCRCKRPESINHVDVSAEIS
jgi:hypothetical protein